MGKTCKDVLDVIPETVVLAFDIAGWTGTTDARRIAEAKKIREAMEKALAEKGKELIKKHFEGKEITQEDALAMLESAGSKLLDNRKNELLKRLDCAWKESPLGVWLDKNEWVLYVFAPLVVGGAGTWMYVAKTGDSVAGMAASAGNFKKTWDIKKLGKITLGTSDVTFVPSKREIKGKTFTKLDFERVGIKLSVGSGMKEDKWVGVDPGLDLRIGLARDLNLNFGTAFTGLGTRYPGARWTGKSTFGLDYKGSGGAQGLTFSLGGEMAYDRFGIYQYGAKAGAKYQFKRTPIPLMLGADANLGQHLRPGDTFLDPDNKAKSGFHWGVGLTLSAHF